MNKSRKKIFLTNDIIWLAIFIALSMVVISAIDFKMKSGVKSINVEIIPLKSSKNLITKKEVLELMRNWQGYNPEMANLEELDIKAMEEMLNKVDFIKNAEVYLNARNIINVVILQREPIVRISMEGGDYYLDENGAYVPFSKNSTVRVPVATGSIESFTHNYLKEKNSKLKDVFLLSKKISNDPFLHALVEQIHVKENGEFVLIPKVGREKIFFGYVDRMNEKFENLKIFYKNAIPREGWNKYKYFDLRWKDQVVSGLRIN